jgi:hypothetical protein
MSREQPRSRRRRAVLILSALVVIVICGGVAAALLVKAALRGPVASVYIGNNYLADVRDARDNQALHRLCPDAQRAALADGFLDELKQARAHGHLVATFDVPVTFDRETLSAHAALGTVTFTDGVKQDVTFAVEWHAGSSCIADGYAIVTQ